MQWIFLLGAIVYYLYRAYQQEAQKNVNKPLTPVNKPIRQGQKQTADTQKPRAKSLKEIWQELQEAAWQQNEPPIHLPEKPKKPEKKVKSIEYEDDLFRTGEALDKVPLEEGGTASLAFKPMAEYEEKIAVQKFIRVNGKNLTPKETFIASIIWEKKV